MNLTIKKCSETVAAAQRKITTSDSLFKNNETAYAAIQTQQLLNT